MRCTARWRSWARASRREPDLPPGHDAVLRLLNGRARREGEHDAREVGTGKGSGGPGAASGVQRRGRHAERDVHGFLRTGDSGGRLVTPAIATRPLARDGHHAVTRKPSERAVAG